MKRAHDSGLTETAPCGYRAAPMQARSLDKKSIATGKRVLRARKAMARR